MNKVRSATLLDMNLEKSHVKELVCVVCVCVLYVQSEDILANPLSLHTDRRVLLLL